MPKKLLEIAADIVQAQASVGQMSSDDIASTLAKTFATLQRMQKCEDEGALMDVVTQVEAFQPDEQVPEVLKAQESIQNDKIICLECGMEFRQLTAKHLVSHVLTPREYKKKHGFALKTPLSAKSLTKARSKAAKKRGLPESLVRYQEERRQAKAEASVLEAVSQEAAVPEAAVLEQSESMQSPTKRGRRKKAES
jgi:predicted transcriptional regulator